MVVMVTSWILQATPQTLTVILLVSPWWRKQGLCLKSQLISISKHQCRLPKQNPLLMHVALSFLCLTVLTQLTMNFWLPWQRLFYLLQALAQSISTSSFGNWMDLQTTSKSHSATLLDSVQWQPNSKNCSWRTRIQWSLSHYHPCYELLCRSVLAVDLEQYPDCVSSAWRHCQIWFGWGNGRVCPWSAYTWQKMAGVGSWMI